MRAPHIVRRAQYGFTLISMMVGLVISLITICTMLAVYKASIDISTNAARGAVRDGQISVALLAAQVELQQVGYGLAPGESGVLSVSDDGREVLWRYRAYPQSGSRCAGLRLVTTPDDTRIETSPSDALGDRRGLYWLPGKSCTSVDPAPQWASNAQERPRLLASASSFFVPTNRQGGTLTDEAGSLTLTGLRFEQQASSGCLPYAQQSEIEELPSRMQRVILKTASGDQLFSACLPNIRTAPSEG